MNNQPPKSLAVFVSGASTLLEAMINSGIDVSLIVVDRECRGVELAETYSINHLTANRLPFGWSPDKGWQDSPLHGVLSKERQAYSAWLGSTMLAEGIDLVAMAGFMTVLGSDFFDIYQGLILNSHPALLPKHKGAHAVADTLSSGDACGGTTIHIATRELDEGLILAQEKVAIMSGDTESLLHERIKKVERSLYPEVLRDIMTHGVEHLMKFDRSA